MSPGSATRASTSLPGRWPRSSRSCVEIALRSSMVPVEGRIAAPTRRTGSDEIGTPRICGRRPGVYQRVGPDECRRAAGPGEAAVHPDHDEYVLVTVAHRI